MVKYKSMVRKKARAMYLLGGENEDLIQRNDRSDQSSAGF